MAAWTEVKRSESLFSHSVEQLLETNQFHAVSQIHFPSICWIHKVILQLSPAMKSDNLFADCNAARNAWKGVRAQDTQRVALNYDL